MTRFKDKRVIIPAVILLVIVIVSAYFSGVYEWLLPDKTQNGLLHFLDVGEANCAVIECGGEYAVIDAGDGGDGGVFIENKLRSLGINKINTLILTTGSSANIGGALRLIDNFSVENLVCANGIFSDESVFSESVLLVLKRNKTTLKYVNVGDSFDFHDAHIEFIWFSNESKETKRSLVLTVDMLEKRFLFLGDILTEQEREMLEKTKPYVCDVLVAANNGSVYSNSAELLDAVRPGVCVVSCVKTPGKKFLKRMESRDIRVFTTIKSGDITFDCEKDKIITQK